MKRDRKAKFVATLGPASSNKDSIRALFKAGADVFRFNFSHGSHHDHWWPKVRAHSHQGHGPEPINRPAT